MSKNHYLVVDPGGATGWATFDEICRPTGRGIERGVDNFADWIDKLEDPASKIIYEDFRLFGHKAIAQVGSKMEASQVIGILKLKAKEWGAELIAQQPQAHKLGAMYSGKKPGSHATSHDIVAYNHGIYYLTRHGLINSRLTKQRIRNPASDA
jgi:hypothetical protein